jgi:hypothetical protein
MSSGISAPTGQPAGGGAQETAQEVASQAQARAQEVAGQAQDKAQEAASRAKSTVREQVDQRSSDLGQRVSTAAEDLRGVAEHLRSQGKDQPAQLAQKAAERVEGVGGYLQESDGERILRDVEGFGRQRPWAVVAGGLVLGFAASRFLKASSSERYQTYNAADSSTSSNRQARPEQWAGAGATDTAVTDLGHSRA